MSTTSEDPVIDHPEPQASLVQGKTLSTRRSFLAPLTPQRSITHNPKAGLNPLVDAAANIFSTLGRLKGLKSYRQLSKLHQELMQEIQLFQTTAKGLGYSSEHVLVSRYALCATLDDIIQHTPWGAQGQWDQYSLLIAFHPDTINPDRFFAILERITKEPALYIDPLELMYLCLSLGFKGPYRTTVYETDEYNYYRLEQVIQGLYQQIRAYRGDFQKHLSPYFVKPAAPKRQAQKTASLGWALTLTSFFMLIILSGLGYSLGAMISQVNQDLKTIGKTTLYENHS